MCVYVRVIIIIIDGGRGKTGGVAVQRCGGQVHTANIHTYIHLTYIYKCIHKYTYHRYTYTHTHLYNFIYFFFSMNFFSSAAMEERFTSRQCQIVPVQKIRKVSFFLVFYLSCIHTYIQHKCIYTFSTHTYMLPAHIRTSSTQTLHIPSTQTYFLFFSALYNEIQQ